MQMLQGNPLLLPHSLQELLAKDTVQVALVPERKGLFLKHVEYEVSSQVPTDCVWGAVWAGMCEKGQGTAESQAARVSRAPELGVRAKLPSRPVRASCCGSAWPHCPCALGRSFSGRSSGWADCRGKPWQASMVIVLDSGQPRLRMRAPE